MTWFLRSTQVFVLFGVAVCCACASIEYQKVPSPIQYGDHWTIEDQKRADAMEGPRFYLPRPYVNLKQPVPVATRTAFVSFEYRSKLEVRQPDGTVEIRPYHHFALVLPEDSPEWIQRILPPRISVSAAKEFLDQGAEQQAGTIEDDTPEDEDAAEKAAPGDKPPSSLSASVGFINEVDPQTKLGYWMDVVYLPDMDEQYVIKRNYGLGAGDLEIKLRNGWAAETFGESVDNSNLIPYVLDQVERASDVASHVAQGWGGMKNVEQLAGDAAQLASGEGDGATLQSGGILDDDADVSDLLGQLVLFKVAQVKIAQPGLYPIMKPREIKDWFKLMYNQKMGCDPCDPGCAVRGYDPHADLDTALRQLLMNRGLPWINPDRVFVPAPPFTMVGFNVVTDVYLGPVRKDQLGFAVQTSAISPVPPSLDEGGGGGGGGTGGGTQPKPPQTGSYPKLASMVVDSFNTLDQSVRIDQTAPVTATDNAQGNVDFTFTLQVDTNLTLSQLDAASEWLARALNVDGSGAPVQGSQSGTVFIITVSMTPDQLKTAAGVRSD